MFPGMIIPHGVPKPKEPEHFKKETDGVAHFCPKCGCNYLGKCPTHESRRVSPTTWR